MSSATTSASSSIPSFYTMDGTTRFNGSEFSSGLDTQNLIKALTAKTVGKITTQQQRQQQVQWKQEMYHAVEDLLQSFSDSYLSYSTQSSTNLMSKAFFDTEQLVSSAPSVVTATGDASDAGNVQINKVQQLATAATWDGSDVSVTNVHSTAPVGNTVSSSSFLDINVGGTAYNISLGSSVDLTYNGDGTITDASLQKIATNLNAQVKKAGLTGKVAFTAASGSITMTGTDTTATITGASQNFINGLGMTAHTDGGGKVTSYTLGGPVQKSIAALDSQLAGTTLTVQLDGLTKTISFNQSEMTQYADTASLKTYMQSKIDSAFGNGKVTVSDNDGTLVFNVTDTSSVLRFASASDAGMLGEDGVLHIRTGETNRLESDKTLDELVSSKELLTDLSTPLDNGGKKSYAFTVNGKEFTFSGDTELNTVINTVNNDPTANVTISYSQTLNRYRIVSDETGSQDNISVYDNANSGNLAAALFGKNTALNCQVADTDYKDSNKTSVYNVTLNGSSTALTVKGDSNNHSIADFVKTVQTAIDATGTTGLQGKLKAEVSSDGKSVVFQSTDGSTVTMAKDAASTSDILNIGTAGESTSAITKGKDLLMNVTLGGKAMDITRATNSFTLDGITMSVNATTDSKITFSAADNTDDLYKKISTFVDAYNKIISTVNTDVTQMPTSQSTSNGGGTTYAPLTDDQKKQMTDKEIDDWNTKAKQGLLFSNPELSNLQSDLRNAMESAVKSVGLSLADIGISTKAYDYNSGGKLVIEESTLKKAIKDNPSQLEQLFTNSDGVASRLNAVVTKNIGAYGNDGTLVGVAGSSTLIGTDESQFAKEINRYQDNIKDLQATLKNEQESLQAKFTQMESIISRLSSQFNYISSMNGSGS